MQDELAANTADPANGGFNNWAALAAALAGSGLIQNYANSIGEGGLPTGRRLQQFPGVGYLSAVLHCIVCSLALET